ncbi:pectinesterase-like [Aristolochia californica]|uniref:pectinesterase-like n=1 Tax=Aristolochia californica TaxID=171875 RepID=UPI0035DDF5BA
MTRSPEILPVMSNAGDQRRGIAVLGRKHRKPIIVFLSSLLVVAAIISLATGVARKSKHGDENDTTVATSHALLRSSCSSTRYPELCISTVASNPSLLSSLATHKQVIEASINQTVGAVQSTYGKVQTMTQKPNLTPREKVALADCLQTLGDTLDELRETYSCFEVYPSNKPIAEQADDINILLSAAITNQETCIDGFSYNKAETELRKEFESGVLNVKHMCSNVLSMASNMTVSHMPMENGKNSFKGRRMEEEELEDDKYPSWLSAADRKLLQSPSVPADVTVAVDGSGDYTTVSSAVAAAPEESSRRYVIRIKAGVYQENVEVPKKKTNLMFLGDDRRTTIITGSRNVVDGSTTFRSATVAIVGNDFLARGIRFENTAGPSKAQAVALRVGSDLSAFYDCEMVAYQDTLYVHSLRQFFRSCFITGTVDFIFGNAAVVFQDCDIQPRRPNPGQRNMITAQGRDNPDENTGIVIQNCRIAAASDLLPVQSSFPTYLGRPWREYSRTVVMKSNLSNVIQPEGWYPWNGNFALDTLFYGEYQNTGAGAATEGRVKWKGFKVITNATEAQSYTLENFVMGGSWVGNSGFPFTLGL